MVFLAQFKRVVILSPILALSAFGQYAPWADPAPFPGTPSADLLVFGWKPRGVFFSWSFPPGGDGPGCRTQTPTSIPSANPVGDFNAGGFTACGAPIDLSSGIDIITHTDLELDGNLGPIRLVRTMRTAVQGGGGWSPFANGGSHNFSLYMTGNSSASSLALPDGQTIAFEAQPNGTQINLTNAAWQGAVVTFGENPSVRLKNGTVYTFTPPGGWFGCMLAAVTDANGNTITVSHNPDAPWQVTAITDPVGRQLLFTYDGGGFVNEGRVIMITDPLGRSVSYTYNNSINALATYRDANGGVWTYNYDGFGNLTSVVDPRQVTVEQNTYDNNGRVISQVQADGSTISVNYTLSNPTNGNSPVATAVETDQLGSQWTYNFNTPGYLTQITDPTGNTRIFSRSPANLLLGMTGPGTCGTSCGDPTKGDLTFTYDGSGNMLTRTDSLGNTYQYTYDPVFNHVTSATDPVGNVTTYQYDSYGNLIVYIDPRNDKTTITRIPDGLPVTLTDPQNNTTTFQYDQNSNLSVIVDPLQEQTTLSYDPVSRLISTADPTGARNALEWDALDRLVGQTDANGGITSYTYDPVNNLLTLADPRGGKSSYTYDNLSRQITHTDPLNRTEQFSYNPVSNLIQHIDRRGQISTFNYDTIYRLTSETYPDATVSRSYDPYSRLTQVVDSQGGTFSFTWDTAGRLLGSAAPQGAVAYVRDGDGRASSREVTGQPAVSYQYDSASNLTQAAMGTAFVNMTYDSRNALSTASRSNGVSSAYSYDPLDRVLTIAHPGGSNVLSSFTYTYDAAGNRSSAGSSPAQALITQAATGSFDASNEMSSFRSYTYTYDGNGNRLTQTNGSGTTTYTWDGRNRLQSITQPNGTMSTFTYDFNRNLTQYVGGANTTSYVLDDWANVAQISGGASGTLSLLTGQSIDSHYATVNAAGQAQFALVDALGSVAGNSGRSVALDGQSLYEPFGQTTSSGTSFPFAFTGRVPVASGIYYYRNRFYDPVAGRFLSEDDEGFQAGDVNLYRYVRNSPISTGDPMGQAGQNKARNLRRLANDFGNAAGICAGIGTPLLILGGGLGSPVGVIGGAYDFWAGILWGFQGGINWGLDHGWIVAE